MLRAKELPRAWEEKKGGFGFCVRKGECREPPILGVLVLCGERESFGCVGGICFGCLKEVEAERVFGVA
jgi:hypothetical protein